MKSKFILGAAFAALFATSAHAQVQLNITGATAFRAATINSIIAGYGGNLANISVISSASGAAAITGSNAVTFRGTWGGLGDTIIRCKFSGATEGIRDLVGVGGVPNNVGYYADPAPLPPVTATYLNQNNAPVTPNALPPDVAFSDVQQTSSPSKTPILQPADSRVGVVTFVFCKSQGSSANLTNVTDQAWKAALANNRGVPLSLFTCLSGDATGRVLATGRNDGSGTRAVYMIEPGVGVSTLVNQFKTGFNGANGVTSAGSSTDAINLLQLWPSADGEFAENSASIWNSPTTGNGGYFSGSGVTALLTKDTSSVRVLGPTGNDLSSSGSYVATSAGNPRAVSVVAMIATGDAVGAIAANNAGTGAGGASVLSYNGVGITPVPTSVDPTGLVPADRYKVTNGCYTLWSYERLFNRGTLTPNQNTVVYGAGGIVPTIPTLIANTGIALSAMVATRGNDGATVTVP